MQLACRAGLKKAVISLWENDERLPAKKNLHRVAAALAVLPAALLTDANGGAGRTARTRRTATSPPRMAGGTGERTIPPRPVAAACSDRMSQWGFRFLKSHR